MRVDRGQARMEEVLGVGRLREWKEEGGREYDAEVERVSEFVDGSE